MARELEQRIDMGNRLRELRKPLGNGQYEIKQQPAADAAGVTLRAYQAWEGGESDIEWSNLERLAAFFGVDPYWIRDGAREPSQLDRIESKLDLILGLAIAPADQQARDAAVRAAEAAAQRDVPPPPGSAVEPRRPGRRGAAG